MDTCKSFIGSSVNVIESVESKDLKRVLYELCWSGVNGRLKVDQVTATLADVAVSLVCRLTEMCLTQCCGSSFVRSSVVVTSEMLSLSLDDICCLVSLTFNV